MNKAKRIKSLVRTLVMEQLGTPVWVVISKQWVEDPTGPAAEEKKILAVFRSEQTAKAFADKQEGDTDIEKAVLM